MVILVIGLAVFLGIHFVPIFTGFRAQLQNRLGANGYKGLYSLIAIIGLGLTIWGYGLARYTTPILWNPPEWGPYLTAGLMIFSLIFLAASDLPGKIKQTVRHPMITGVAIWGLAHLISNGGLADLLLFGGFLFWAAIGRVSMYKREKAGLISVKDGPVRNDLIAVVAGTVVFLAFIWFGHEWMTGLPVFVF